MVVIHEIFLYHQFCIGVFSFVVGHGFLRHAGKVQERFGFGVAAKMVVAVSTDGSSFPVVEGIILRPFVILNILVLNSLEDKERYESPQRKR